MRIIISPAKKMRVDDSLSYKDLPVFIEDAKHLKDYLKSLDYDELKCLYKCSDKIVHQNIERLETMNLTGDLTPALLAYEGIQYQYMAPNIFDQDSFNYVCDHLRILSGFYGVLKPMDGVTSYRLEMQAKTDIDGKNLYQYWGDRLYQEVLDDSHIIINLASKEYSRCVETYLTKQDRMITCIFGEYVKGKIVQKGVYVKMARGEMVRYMAEHHIDDPEEMKNFHELSYHYDEEASTEDTYVFIRENL